MKHSIYLILILFFLACEKENSEIPGYIKINSITLNEDVSENITDAWVFINDQLQGVYELPTLFPVINIGKNTLRIKAGIKNNGIATNRVPYPFYTSYIEELELTETETIEIQPIVEYIENTSFFLEDFNDGLDLITSDISDTSITMINYNNESYGAGFLTDSLITFEITTDPLENLPQQGSPVFLELDYKANTQFLVGIYINYSLVVKKDLIWVNPKEDWNKIYINLTQTISEGINAPSFSVFIGMKRDFSLDTNAVYLDNIKVIY